MFARMDTAFTGLETSLATLLESIATMQTELHTGISGLTLQLQKFEENVNESFDRIIGLQLDQMSIKSQ